MRSSIFAKISLRGSFATIYVGLFALCLISFGGCSRPKLHISQDAPPTFVLSGNYEIVFFQVSNKTGVNWKLYPRDNKLTLKDLALVKYGEVPLSCQQVIPLNSTPPPSMVEGETYYATVVIQDAGAQNIRFTIKEGKVLELPKEP